MKWFRRTKIAQEVSSQNHKEDLKLTRGCPFFEKNGDISVSYAIPYSRDYSYRSELDWIIRGFFLHYNDKDFDKAQILSNLFFEMFPEQKEKPYPDFMFDVKGGLGCIQRLKDLDEKVEEFGKRACQIFTF